MGEVMDGLKDLPALAPRDEAELARMVAQAEGPLRIVGGGTRSVGRVLAGQGLATSGLKGIRLYEPGALTLVAGAGTPLAEVEAALAAEGQRLPFEPTDHSALLGRAAPGGTGAPTLGGMVAANASGPRRFQAGACRDSLIGLRFVDGTGQVVANGGRVMKNVTGYDLVKLMAGSWGTLGVLTEVAFKLLPCPEAQLVLRRDGLDDPRAVAALIAALRTPYEVTGAAHLQQGAAGRGLVTLIRIEGFASQLPARAEKLRAALAAFGPFEIDTDPVATAATWADLRDLRALAGVPGDVWQLSVLPGEAAGLVARLTAALPGLRAQYDWGGGRVTLLLPEPHTGHDLRAHLGPIRGHATLLRASPATRARIAPFPPQTAAVARLSADLRRSFDPRGIFNPGLMD